MKFADATKIRVLCHERLLGTVFVAAQRKSLRTGLLGGALPGTDGCLLQRCRWIHTFGMKSPIRVIHLDAWGKVMRDDGIVSPNRMGLPSIRGSMVLELLAEAPGFEYPVSKGQCLTMSVERTDNS